MDDDAVARTRATHEQIERLRHAAGPAGRELTAESASVSGRIGTPPLEVLRAQASHGDYASMARLARALHAGGLQPPGVLTECYGVHFPAELFAIMDDFWSLEDRLPVRFTRQPWQLAVPLDLGGPAPKAGWLGRVEQRIHTHDPDLVPLVQLHYENRPAYGSVTPLPPARHGGLITCYRYTELAAGRSTIFGVPTRLVDRPGRRADAAPWRVVTCGPALLTVLYEHFIDRLHLDEWEYGQEWNRGAGSIDREDVNQSRENVRLIEALQSQAR
jgi:hypothetical protein